MPYALKIALRYLAANRGQTGLLVVGVAVGVFVFVFMSALIGGLAVLLIDRTVGNVAHVTVEAAERDPRPLFGSGPETLTAVLKTGRLGPPLEAAATFLPIIASTPHVRTVAAEVLGNGFLRKGEAVAPVTVIGVEPGEVSAIADIARGLVAGSSDLTLSTALLGQGLATRLGLRVGQTFVIRSAQNVEQILTVGGIFALGVAAVDDTAAYVNLRAARVLFGLPQGISRFEIKLDDLQLAPQVAAAIAAETGLKATPWTARNQELLDGLEAQARSGDLIKGFALVTIVIGVASALLLSTYRRRPEIGIMRAMGASRRFVLMVFVIQGALIGLAGGALGAGLGFLVLLPFPLPELTPSGGLPIDIRQGAYLTAVLLTLAGAVAASIWPANAAARVDPVTAIGA